MALSNTQREWVLQTPARRVSTLYLPEHNGLTARFISTSFYVSNDSSSIGYQVFDPRVAGPFEIPRRGGGYLIGRQRTQFVSTRIDLVNEGSDISQWVSEGWEKRPVEIRWGDWEWLNWDDHIVDLVGQVESMVPQGNLLILTVRDNLQALDGNWPADSYLSGESSGEIKPRVYGRVLRGEAKPINASTLIYSCSENGGAVQAVYDRGVLLTPTADWVAVDSDDSRQVDLDNALGKITHDTDGATGPDFDIGVVLEHYLLDVGLASSQIDGDGLSNIAGGVTREVGFYADQSRPISDAIEMFAQSVGAMVFQNRDQKITAVQIKVPNGNSIHEFDQTVLAGGVDVSLATEAMPGLRLAVRVGWTKHDRDSLSGVSDFELSQAERNLLVKEYTSLAINQPAGDSNRLDTLLINTAQGISEGNRQAAILEYPHYSFAFEPLIGATLVDIGSVVRVAHEHVDVAELGMFLDHNGEPLQDEHYQPFEFGRDVLIDSITDHRPFGSASIIGWS